MSGMTTAREQVTADLKAVGLNVQDHVPAKVVPPLVIMGPQDPMLEESNTMSGTEFVYNLGLLILIPSGKPNSEALKSLEALVEKVIFNLGDWSITNVGPVVYMAMNDIAYPSVEVSISTTIQIEGGN